MSGLHYIITGSIEDTLPIYPVNLTLLFFFTKKATSDFYNLSPVVMLPEFLKTGLLGLHYIITGSIEDTLPIYPVNLTLLAFTPKEATVTFFEICPKLSCVSNSSKQVCQGCTILSPPALGAPCLFILLIFPCSHLLPRKLQ